jgi:hypothetical protein
VAFDKYNPDFQPVLDGNGQSGPRWKGEALTKSRHAGKISSSYTEFNEL